MVYGDHVYGDTDPYGGSVPVPGSSAQSCVCGDVWRFEATELTTGRVKAVLHPISVTWETNLAKPGQGQMVIATRQYAADQIWPDTTGLFVSRVHTAPNSEVTRECVFGGYVNEYRGSSGGATTLGIVTIDEYLNHRVIADADSGLAYTATGKDQNQLCTELVALAHWDGIPLTGLPVPSASVRDRSWQAWEFKNIGEAIQELITEPDGPLYEPVHTYSDGYWSSVLRFADTVGADRGVKLRSDYEGLAYQVVVDGKDHATRVYGIGQGEQAAQLTVVAYDAAAPSIGYPEFHATPAWKDTPDVSTLEGLTRGYVVNHRDPAATPGMSVAGLDPQPSQLVNGDRVYVDIQYGLVTFQGFARILSQEWAFSTDNPLIRTFGFGPEVRAADSVKLMPSLNPPTSSPNPPTSPTPGTPPDLSTAEPQAGLVSKMTDSRIDESSGMTHSRKW